MKIFGVILFAYGLLSILLRNQIIKMIGPSGKKDFTLEQRELKIIIAGIGFIIVGLLMFFKNC